MLFVPVKERLPEAIKKMPEPVGEIASMYRLIFMDLSTVAGELDVDNPAEIVTKVGEKKLKQLGLENLVRKGGVISRTEWEARDGVS